MLGSQLVSELIGKVFSEQFGRRVLDGQQDAIFTGEDPLLVAVGQANALFALMHVDEVAARRDQHVVVEGIRQLAHDVLEGDEIENVIVLVERGFDFHGHAIVVAVQALTIVAAVRDEMPGTEDQVIFGDTDCKAFGHELFQVTSFELQLSG